MARPKKLINVHYVPSITMQHLRLGDRSAVTSFATVEENKAKDEHEAVDSKQIFAELLRGDSAVEMIDVHTSDLQKP